jgi:tellurite resistance protein TerC
MDVLFSNFLDKPVWMWIFFILIVLVLLILDLGVFHRKVREIGVKESLALSAFYITLGLLFGAWVWWYLGPTAGINYVTGFVIEKSLAMDNIFVIAMIFSYFSIPRIYQQSLILGNYRCNFSKSYHDWRGRNTGQPIFMGSLYICSLSYFYRDKNVAKC